MENGWAPPRVTSDQSTSDRTAMAGFRRTSFRGWGIAVLLEAWRIHQYFNGSGANFKTSMATNRVFNPPRVQCSQAACMGTEFFVCTPIHAGRSNPCLLKRASYAKLFVVRTALALSE
eukprot:1881979-Amphidinium_carterae.1